VISLLAVLGRGVLDAAQAVIRADDPGLTRGDGCFEGCRVRTDDAGRSRVDKLDAHLARMGRSAAALDIAFDAEAWRRFVTDTLAGWTSAGEWGLKLVLTRGAPGADPVGLFVLTPLPEHYPAQRRDGIAVITLDRGTAADAYATAPWLLGGVKTLSYVINMAAQREAARRGAADVIFTSADGYVLEAPTSSVVWALGDTLHTTPLGGTGILGGTTQQLLFERAGAAGWRTVSRLARVEDLHAADSLWLVGTVRGPVDVISIDGCPRGRDEARTAAVRALCGF
jgi:4-amino-4-deoxychorismate lyase